MSERLRNFDTQAAARAAAAIVALASAAGIEAKTAEAKPNPVIVATEQHIGDISDEMAAMLGRDNTKAYRDHPVIQGLRVTRDVVVYKEKSSGHGAPLYDQAITYTAPAEKTPYIFSWITGTPDKKFTIGEKHRTYFTISRITNHPKSYHVQYMWPEVVESAGKKRTVKRNIEFELSDSNFGTDMQLGQKSQMLDDMTAEAKGVIDMVAAELKIPPA